MENKDQNASAGYLLIIRGYDWDKNMSAEELQQTMGKFSNWIAKMTEQGIVLGANPLLKEGKVLSGTGGQIVTDGPFAESKEAVGGYFLLQLDTLDEAVALAKECPLLGWGPLVEVRPVAAMCPVQRAAEELARASSAS